MVHRAFLVQTIFVISHHMSEMGNRSWPMKPFVCWHVIGGFSSVSPQAQQLLSACQEKIDVSNTEGYELFLSQLKEGLKNTSHETAANHKVAKVFLILPLKIWHLFFLSFFQLYPYALPNLHPPVSRLTPVSLFQWATVTFHLPHHVLKLVASAIVSELKKVNQNVAALSVASSIMDRLSYLLSSARPELGVGPGRSVDR